MKIFIFLLIFFLKINYSLADSKITYIDINFILTNSIVGQSINSYINTIQNENIKKFKEQEKVLSEKENKLLSQKNILEKEKFNNELKILNEEINKYKIERKNILNELNKKKINYTKEVLNNLNPIITDYVEKNLVSIVLPKKNIIVGKKDLDITEDILKLLNNKITEINF
tara:strand:+ start:935 stop:1447 length:513 start_codon:yes stop_codon:yes gene_type:complete